MQGTLRLAHRIDRRLRFSLALVAVLGGLGVAAPAAAATDYSFTGSGNWSVGSNWTPTGPPASGFGTLSFPATSCSSTACPASTDDISGLSGGTLSIQSPTSTSGPPPMGWQLNGSQTLTLNSGLSLSANSNTAPSTSMGSVRMPLLLGASNTWTVSRGQFSVVGGVSGNQPLAMNVSNGGTLTFANASNEVGAVTITGIGSGSGPFGPLNTVGVQGDLNGTNGHAVNLSNATLYGSGVTGPGGTATLGALSTSNGAFVSTGGTQNPTGSISVTGATLDSTSTAHFTIADTTGTTAGTDYSQLTSTGAINLAGAQLDIFGGTQSGCVNPSVGTTYTLVSTTGTLSGAFGNAPNGGFVKLDCPSGSTNVYFQIQYTAHAVTAKAVQGYTWSGGAPVGQPNWSNNSNWSGGVAPTSSSTIAAAAFPRLTSGACTASPPTATCYTSHNDLTGLSLGSLQIGTGYHIDGNAINLGNGGLSNTFAGIGSAQVALPIALTANQTWTGGGIGFSRAISGSGSTLTINPGGGSMGFSADVEVGNVAVNGSDTTQTGANAQNNGVVHLFSSSKLNATDGNSVTVTDAGLLSDGAPIGALTSQGGYIQVGQQGTPAGTVSTPSATFDAASMVDFEIPGNGTVAGTDYGQLTSTGAVNLGGASLAINHSGGCGSPAQGAVYTLVNTTGTLSGTFGNAPNNGTITDNCSGATFQINYTAHTVTATVTSTGPPPPPPAPVNTSLPTISGTTKQGQTLTESHGTWTNGPIMGYMYRWLDCDSAGNNCAAISGATNQTYTLTSSDVGHTIRVAETASNARGPGTPANSAPTAVVTSSSPSGGNGGKPKPKCVVPKLKGKTLKQAKKALKKAHCRLGKVTGKKKKHGHVKKQGRKRGKVFPAGTKVSIKLG